MTTVSASRRRRIGLLAVVAAVILLGVIALTLFLVRRSPVPAPATSTTIATWHFDEGTGSNAFDATGNGHTGNIAGAAWAPGQSGQSRDFSLDFNGPSSQVAIDTASDLDVTTSIGIDVWVNFNAGVGATTETILAKDGSQSPYALRISAAGQIGLSWDNAWLESDPLGWADGVWYHLSVVNNGTTTTFSRNGTSVGSIATPGPTSMSSGPLVIGRGSVGAEDWFNGKIDDLSLSVPDSGRPPAIASASLSASSLPVGAPLTISATVRGSWANPDDPTEIDVWGHVTTPGGATQDISGFFYQDFSVDDTARTITPSGTPDWQIRYTPRIAGIYAVTLDAQTRDGRTVTRSYQFSATIPSAPEYRGYVQIDTVNPHYFQYSGSGKSFFGIGADLDLPELTKFLCVPSTQAASFCLPTSSPTRGLFGDGGNKPAGGGTPANLYLVYETYRTALADLAAQGANSGRLRLDSRFLPLELSATYTGIPGYPRGVPDFIIGRYYEPNAWIADQLISLAAHDGIALQVTTWNADVLPWGDVYAKDKNQALVERRLRYEVARWGYSPAVLSWELFNESGIQPAKDPFWVNETSWLRSIDVNTHIITNSNTGIDTNEKHDYVGRTGNFTHLTTFPTGRKPHSVSEYGPDAFYQLPLGYDPQGLKAREGLWASLMGQRAAAWYWWLQEQIIPDNLFRQVFHGISAFAAGEDLGSLRWVSAKFTQMSGPGGLSYYGMVGSDHHALVWIVRTSSNSLVDNPPAKGNVVALAGLAPNHRYAVQWWDTVAGTVVDTSSASSNSAGQVQLIVPSGVTRDIAAKVLP